MCGCKKKQRVCKLDDDDFKKMSAMPLSTSVTDTGTTGTIGTTGTTGTTSTKTKTEKIFDEIAENRRFEIQMLWQRAMYFWAFIASLYAAYFKVLTEGGCFFDSCVGNLCVRNIILCIISFLCFVFSFCWYLVCRSGRYWQENWEGLYYKFEKDVVGPLYDIHLYKKPCKKWHPFEAYAFPVSKINIFLSFLIKMGSLLFFIFNLISLFTEIDCILIFIIIMAVLILFSVIKLICCFFSEDKYEIVNDKSDEDFYIIDEEVYDKELKK